MMLSSNRCPTNLVLVSLLLFFKLNQHFVSSASSILNTPSLKAVIFKLPRHGAFPNQHDTDHQASEYTKTTTTTTTNVSKKTTPMNHPTRVQESSRKEFRLWKKRPQEAATNIVASTTTEIITTEQQQQPAVVDVVVAVTESIHNTIALRVIYAVSFLVFFSYSMVLLAPVQALVHHTSSRNGSSDMDNSGNTALLLAALTATAAIFELLCAPTFGMWLDRAGRKPALRTTLLVMAVTHFGTALSPISVTTLCLAKLIGAVSVSLFFVTTQAILGDVLVVVNANNENSNNNNNGVSSAMGFQSALSGVGFSVGILCAGLVGDNIASLYSISAIVGMITVVLIQWKLPETLTHRPVTITTSQSPSSRTLRFPSPVSCIRLLTRHGPQVRVLGILLMLMTFPMFMGDVFQIYAKAEWDLSPKQLSSLFALFSGISIFSNIIGSLLVRRLGNKSFTSIAIVSKLITAAGPVFFGYRGNMVGLLLGFLGNAQQIGVVAALVGAPTGMSQGELAGERASLMALLKILGPVLYSCLYIQGQRYLGTKKLPFVFNVGLSVVALFISQVHLQ